METQSVRLFDSSLAITRLVFTVGTLFMLALVWTALPHRIESVVLAGVLIAPTSLLWTSADPARVRGAVMALALLYVTISVALRLVTGVC